MLAKIGNFISKCMWLTASALSCCLGLIVGTLMSPTSFVALLLDSIFATTRFFEESLYSSQMKDNAKHIRESLKAGKVSETFTNSVSLPTGICLTLAHDVLFLSYMSTYMSIIDRYCHKETGVTEL